MTKAEKARRQKAWRERNKAHIAEYNRSYRAANPEIISAARDRHRSKNVLYVRRWKERNPEGVAADNTRKRKRDPDYMTAAINKRRTRVAGGGGSYTAAEFRELGTVCAYCGQECVPTADHIIPVARGGSSFIENIAPACRSCNSSKGTLTAEEYLSSDRLRRRLARIAKARAADRAA